MLSESLQELLSAYVDGELTPAEYERVLAALRDSVVARDYVQQLRELSGQLKGLPKLAVPTSFSVHYLKHDRQVRQRRRVWRWAAVGAAAAALIAGLSMWLAQPPVPVQPQGPGNLQIAKHHPPPVLPDRLDPDRPPVVSPAALWLADLGQRAADWSRSQLGEWNTRVDATVSMLANAAEAVAKNDRNQRELLASRMKDPGNPFGTTDIELPPHVTPDKFQLADLQKHWARKGLFQADLVCADTLKALTRLNEACKQHGLTLILDEEVQQRLEKRLPATFMVYLENVSDDTLAKVWTTLQELDHWRDAMNAADTSCVSINFTAPDSDTRKLLARSMGMPADKLTSPRAATTPAPPLAIVLGYHPHRLPENISPPVRQALATQGGPRPDAVSVLYYLRSNK